jgi:hypothetical protein
MSEDLVAHLLAEAREACDGDYEKMAWYLAGIAAGVIDAIPQSVSAGYVRRRGAAPQ